MYKNNNNILGALANIKTKTLKKALKLVKHGKIYDLGFELSNQIPVSSEDEVPRFLVLPFRTREGTRKEFSGGISFYAEVIQGFLHTSTHIDAFVHAQHNGKIYGGLDASNVQTDFGWNLYGAETIRPIITRGVIVNVADFKDVSCLDDGYLITIKDIQDCMNKQSVRIEEGDVVLVRTGKARQFITDKKKFILGCPGLTVNAANWLADLNIAVLGIDTPSPDPLGEKERVDFPVHRVLLIERGVHIIENINLEDLVLEHVSEFLFICLPLKIKGATGSWVRPIAIT
jgi:kynurenine formamidase